MMGIYKIRSIIHPDRIYIGSAVHFKNRKTDHLRDLKNNKHHSKKLQNHYNKYSKDDLIFEFIEECNRVDLLIKEQEHIDLNCPFFNTQKIIGSNLGIPMSEEQKIKISLAQKGVKRKPQTEEAKIKIGLANKGIVFTNERKLKISKSLKGRVFSDERKKKMSEIFTGRKMSENMREKTSERMKGNKLRKGKVLSDETKKKIGIANKGRIKSEEEITAISLRMTGIKNMLGRKQSEETKEKISKANRGKSSYFKGRKRSEITRLRIKESWIRRKQNISA